jgi:16S rRNA (uracil1498-N3)-methyltransferase
MPRYDFRSPRLYFDSPLSVGATLPLGSAQAHYLADVLRLKAGDHVLVFNGIHGEWGAALVQASRRNLALQVEQQTRAQTAPTDLHYLFAPLKRARLDYMVQKAVEMGVSRLAPVITRHTNAERVNTERMRANAIEAAEQCGILNLPEIETPVSFAAALAGLAPKRMLVFCDEDAPDGSTITLGVPGDRQRSPAAGDGGGDDRAARGATTPAIAVLVGPEGGFSDDERAALLARPNIVRLSLGPRILRAETAAVAALALVQARLGDWL